MAITICTITATIKDLIDTVPANLEAYLLVKAGSAFFHGDTLIPAFEQRADFDDVTGVAEIEVIETETPAKKLQFSIVYTDGVREKVIRFKPAIVPDAASADLSELTEVDQYSTF
jgi:hypothetical protein